MRGTHSFLLNEENIDFSIDTGTCFNPPVLNIQQGFESIHHHISNEQLVQLEYAIRMHLDGIGYPEIPDQQQILNAEINQAIEEAAS